MKIIFSIIGIFAISIITFISCKDETHDDMIVCTMEFRYVNIKVIGNPLDTCYTVRLSTGDTIRPNGSIASWGDQMYPVLNDGYQPQMINRVDSFRFCGSIGQTQVVNEVFIIKADECHIDYVSGRNEVTL